MEKTFLKVGICFTLALLPVVAMGADELWVYEGFDLTNQATLDPGDKGDTSFGFLEGWEVPTGTNVALGTDGASLSVPAGYGATTADGRLDDFGTKVIKREFDNISLDLTTEGDEYWISMVAQKTLAVPATSAYLYMLLQDNTTEDNPDNKILNGICMGYASSSKADISINYLYPLGANRAQSGNPLSENDQLFVAKITTHSIADGGTTDNDEYTLWTFDAVTDTIPTMAPDVALGLSVVNDSETNNLSLNKISIGTQTNSDFQLDEIRIGNSWAAVTGAASVEPDPIPGDANGDQKVDGSDVTILAGNWQAGVGDPNPTLITWEMGDFNGDGQVDGSDVTILAGNWQYGVEAAASAVPEPSMLAMLAALAMALPMITRRRTK